MSTTEQTPSLDPEGVDPQALDPEAYHTVIGPALQVTAEVAAARGDPTLHADMPAMLALIDLVTRLADYWCAEETGGSDSNETLADAPTAACVMVLQEAEMPPDSIGQCLGALESAYQSLLSDDVTDVAATSVERAWQQFGNNQRDAAIAQLKQGAQQIVGAIDAWQARLH